MKELSSLAVNTQGAEDVMLNSSNIAAKEEALADVNPSMKSFFFSVEIHEIILQ